MKRACVIFLAMLLSVIPVASLGSQTVKAEPSSARWNNTYGGTNSDRAFALVQTGDGGYALAGYTFSFGAGNYDFWLVKTDASGTMMWNRTYGGTGQDEARALVQTADGGYALAGYTESFGAGNWDFWLVKTDASGNAQWNKTYGGTSNDWARAVVQTSDGGYTLAGLTWSFGTGGCDFWLVKTDVSGNAQWNKTYGGTGNDEAYALVQTSDGGYALAGVTLSFGARGPDFWLVKTDASGIVQWNKTYGETGNDYAYALVQTGDGGYALTGYTLTSGAGNEDECWLVKTDASGTMQWNMTYGGTSDDWAHALVQTSDGGYALAGVTLSFGAGGSSFWLVKTDASGNAQWNKTYGETGNDWAHALVQTSDGGYALAGRTYSLDRSDDFWLVRTDENGVVPEFPSHMILAALFVVTSSAVILAKRKSKKALLARIVDVRFSENGTARIVRSLARAKRFMFSIRHVQRVSNSISTLFMIRKSGRGMGKPENNFLPLGSSDSEKEN